MKSVAEAVANVNVDDKPDREKQPEAAKGNSTLESKLGEVKGKSSDANQSLSEKKTEEDKKKVSTEKVVLPENKASKISQNKIQKKPTPQKIKVCSIIERYLPEHAHEHYTNVCWWPTATRR